MTERILDKFRGCLVGLAVGDALGMPAEEMIPERIQQLWGEIRDYQQPPAGHPCAHLGPGQYTDDTQLALVTANSLLRVGGFNAEVLAEEIGAWGKRIDFSLEADRYSGVGCLTAARRLYNGTPWQECASRSAGNGTAMRVAPVGMLYYRNLGEVTRHAATSSLITHSDRRATGGAVSVALTVALLINDINLAVLLPKITTLTEHFSEEIAVKLLKANTLLQEADPARALAEIGTSGFVSQSVPAAIYCFLHHSASFEDAVILAANAGGDTDTIAAMVGAMSGACLGLQAIPQRWRDNLEGYRQIVDTADRLYELSRKAATPA